MLTRRKVNGIILCAGAVLSRTEIEREIMLSVEQVADHILAMSPYGCLSNRELQKMLYFAQGFHLATKGEPLFADTMYAWDFGPVSLTIWHKFKAFGYSSITPPPKEKLAPLTGDIAAFLSTIVIAFGTFNQGQLIEMTHADTPWASSYIPQTNKVLEKDTLRNYFSSFASLDEYLLFAREKLAFHDLVAQRSHYLRELHLIGNDWISGKSVAPSVEVCNLARRFIGGLERFIFASGPKPEVPKLILGPVPSGGVGLEFKSTKSALYVQLHNSGLVEVDVEKNGKFDGIEISVPEFEEDLTPYYKELV